MIRLSYSLGLLLLAHFSLALWPYPYFPAPNQAAAMADANVREEKIRAAQALAQANQAKIEARAASRAAVLAKNRAKGVAKAVAKAVAMAKMDRAAASAQAAANIERAKFMPIVPMVPPMNPLVPAPGSIPITPPVLPIPNLPFSFSNALPSYVIPDYNIKVIKTLPQLYSLRTTPCKRTQVILVVDEQCRSCKKMLFKLINKKIQFKSHFDIILFFYNNSIPQFRQFQKELGLTAVPDIIIRRPQIIPKGLFKIYPKKNINNFFSKFWMFRAKKIREHHLMLQIAALRKQAERMKRMKMSNRDRIRVNRIMARKLDKLISGH